MADTTQETEDVQKVLNVTEGGQLTIYHESLKNVTFCTVKPPFFPGYLRAGFGKNRADWDLDLTKLAR